MSYFYFLRSICFCFSVKTLWDWLVPKGNTNIWTVKMSHKSGASCRHFRSKHKINMSARLFPSTILSFLYLPCQSLLELFKRSLFVQDSFLKKSKLFNCWKKLILNYLVLMIYQNIGYLWIEYRPVEAATILSLHECHQQVAQPVIKRRRNRIMCRPRVVGMPRPNNRDRLARWKRRWWVCSHSSQEVALSAAAWIPEVAGGKGDNVVKSRGCSSGVEDILQQGHLEN